jgi:hypothetical protein
MPVHKVKGGYKWGKTGKVYSTKSQADKQARAIYANGWRGTNENIDTIKLTQLDLNEMIKDVINEIIKRK